MSSSRTETPTTDSSYDRFSINIGFQIQCFALNKDANRVIVAGRNAMKLLNIDENRFIDIKLEHRFSAFQFSLMDVCWSHVDDSLLVSCASDGGLQKWKQTENSFTLDSSLSIHNRTVNKINLSPTEANYLLSGDQDGYIHLSDLRIKSNPTKSFRHDQNDVVTDIKFNPSNPYQFASASDSGCFYIWDYRNTQKLDKKQNVHSSGVYIDWHPDEKNTLATASRDRKIHIWDMNTKEKKYSILHSEGVSSIKWRPKNATQIAASSSNSLIVWDYKRPCVPYALFDSNKYTNFLWRNSPDIIVAFANTYLFNDCIKNARRPAERANESIVDIDKYGALTFTCLRKSTSFSSEDDDDAKSTQSDFSLLQDTYDTKFKQNKNEVYLNVDIVDLKQDWFLNAVKNYRFQDDTFANLCDSNAQVAFKYNKLSIYKDWTILKSIYLETDKDELKKDEQKQEKKSQINNDTFNKLNYQNMTKRSNEDQISFNGSVDGLFPEDFYNNHDLEPIIDENAVFKVIDDEDETSLLPNDIIEFNEFNELFDDYQQTDKSTHNLAENNIAIVAETSPNQNEDCDASTTSQQTREFRLNILSKYMEPEKPKLNFDKYFQEILIMYIEEQFDLPTAITMYLVACKSSCFKATSINQAYLDEWFSQYIELLAKYDQWMLRSEILKAHQSEFLEKTTQISINYLTMCAMCKEEIPRSTLVCSKCKKNPFLCSLCHLPVKTLYAWCHLCYHGGHMKHLKNWFSKQRECPTGCGCLCWNSNSKID